MWTDNIEDSQDKKLTIFRNQFDEHFWDFTITLIFGIRQTCNYFTEVWPSHYLTVIDWILYFYIQEALSYTLLINISDIRSLLQLQWSLLLAWGGLIKKCSSSQVSLVIMRLVWVYSMTVVFSWLLKCGCKFIVMLCAVRCTSVGCCASVTGNLRHCDARVSVVAARAPWALVESFRGQCNVVFLFLTGGSRLSHCSGLSDITLSVLRLIID